MLRINLLPDTQKSSSATEALQLYRMPIVWVGAAVLVTLLLFPVFLYEIRVRELSSLRAQIDDLSPKRDAIDNVQRLLDRLREQEASFAGVSQDNHNWSARLNALSNVTPEGVWFEELYLEREKGLLIKGSAIGEGGAEMMRVGRLVQDLKGDAGFSSAVNDIQIESIKRVQSREVEIVKFTLSCTLAKK